MSEGSIEREESLKGVANFHDGTGDDGGGFKVSREGVKGVKSIEVSF